MSFQLDKDGQPYNRFHFANNKQKALCSLKGILTGVACDKKLMPSELVFLNAWLKEHEFLHDDSEALFLIELLDGILHDGMISDDEHEAIFNLVEDFIDYKALDDSKCKDHMNLLLGILKGISADANINDAEIIFFKNWLAENTDIADIWPVPLLTEKVDQILADGVITTEEREELYQLITLVTGNDFNETGDAVGTPMQCFDAAHISHAGKCFCFTGKFRSGTRANVEDKAKSLGAVEIKKYPTLTTHYVVVGSLSSRDWLYSSHGTKIQQAKSMQAKGHNIAVISEDQWLSAAK